MNKTKKIILAMTGLFIAAITGFITMHRSAEKTPAIHLTHPGYAAGPYRVQIRLQPKKPAVGNNRLILSLRDAKNRPVSDAQIEAHVEMPAMGSMPAMREPVSFTPGGNGVYQGRYQIPMTGLWPLTLHIDSSALGPAELSFDMSTSRPGLQLTTATPGTLSTESRKPRTVRQTGLAPFQVAERRRQLIGVTTARAIEKAMHRTIRTHARVDYNRSRFTDITLKYDAWIGRLNADFIGKPMHSGDTLFTVYSPELVSAQDEFLHSLHGKGHDRHSLQNAARQRLRQWDIDAAQIRSLAKRGRVHEYLPIASPVDGTVIEKNIAMGSAVKAGTRLLRLADLSTVWVEGEIYEADFPWLETGLMADISLPDIPGQTYSAAVSFISPVLQEKTRTVIIRVELANPEGRLRPGMFASMAIDIDLGTRLVVPEQAVIYAGEQRIVFVDLGDGRLQPRKIKTGLRNVDEIEVLTGLSSGESIVTSGNFLIASESKMKAGLAQW